MRAVNSGSSFYIYDNSVKLYNSLPSQVYRVAFDPRQGFSLVVHPDIAITEKVYGVHEAKVDKVMNSFMTFNRNLGVILSGDKGIGKSLFAKMLCQRATACGFPVVICDACHPGVGQFLDSIDQPIVVLFDEFDKTFKSASADSDQVDAQATMLSLFDGISMNKKLFVVTCNEISKLNGFLINRPGRFHYHFRFEYPSKEEIEVYMRDHLDPSKFGEIEKVTDFARKVELNYDCLRAICFELASCDSFEEAISDLNILRAKFGQPCGIWVLFKNGTRMYTRQHIDLFSSETVSLSFGCDIVEDDFLTVTFAPVNAAYSSEFGGYWLPENMLTCNLDINLEDQQNWIVRKSGDFVRAHLPKDVSGVLIKPELGKKSIHYFSA